MHYFIDGYNLLFRITKEYEEMKAQQKPIMLALNQWAEELQLNLTLVFDGKQKDPAEAIRGHLDQLEVIYTPLHQTADEYILKELEQCAIPQEETVITSDRDLATKSKLTGAHAKSIEGFLAFLSKKRHKVKVKQRRPVSESPRELMRLQKVFEEKLKNPEDF